MIPSYRRDDFPAAICEADFILDPHADFVGPGVGKIPQRHFLSQNYVAGGTVQEVGLKAIAHFFDIAACPLGANADAVLSRAPRCIPEHEIVQAGNFLSVEKASLNFHWYWRLATRFEGPLVGIMLQVKYAQGCGMPVFRGKLVVQ